MTLSIAINYCENMEEEERRESLYRYNKLMKDSNGKRNKVPSDRKEEREGRESSFSFIGSRDCGECALSHSQERESAP
jgi:hypothetical protein